MPGAAKDVPQLSKVQSAALALLADMAGGGRRVGLDEWRAVARDNPALSTAEKPDDRRRACANILRALTQKSAVWIVGDMIHLARPAHLDFDDLSSIDADRTGSEAD